MAVPWLVIINAVTCVLGLSVGLSLGSDPMRGLFAGLVFCLPAVLYLVHRRFQSSEIAFWLSVLSNIGFIVLALGLALVVATGLAGFVAVAPIVLLCGLVCATNIKSSRTTYGSAKCED